MTEAEVTELLGDMKDLDDEADVEFALSIPKL